MEADLWIQERQALRAEVGRFAAQGIAAKVLRPESPLPPEELASLLRRADDLGLAGSTNEPTGLGAWELLVGEGIPGPTLEMLVVLGGANPGSAFAIHQRGLARAACRLAQLAAGNQVSLAIAATGAYGLGRRGILRWLARVQFGDDDRALLEDVYGPVRSRLVTVEHDFAAAILPVWVGDDLQWMIAPQADLRPRTLGHAHGLDELATVALTVPAAAIAADASPAVNPAASPAADAATSMAASAVSVLDATDSRAAFTALAGAHQLAAVAIARGAVEHGLTIARRFAAERVQGGAIIDSHPAVLDLLGRCRSALVVVDALLERASTRPLDPDGLVAALAVRSQATPLLADAANAALQVLGGSGYMREVGVEKVVRDVNHLRAITGPLGELRLLVAEWERLHD